MLMLHMMDVVLMNTVESLPEGIPSVVSVMLIAINWVTVVMILI